MNKEPNKGNEPNNDEAKVLSDEELERRHGDSPPAALIPNSQLTLWPPTVDRFQQFSAFTLIFQTSAF